MYDIALCENNPSDAATIQNILDDYEEYTNDALRVKYFPDSESLTQSVLSGSYRPDVILSEINLPGMSGIEAMRKLRSENFKGAVVFVTSSADYALDAWEVSASQYIVKPVTSLKIFAALTDILIRRNFIVVRQKKALRKISFSEILYVETRGKYQVIITRSEELPVRITAREMHKLIPLPHSCNFIDLGLTYLVNLENVKILCDGRVIFDGGKELLISRRRFKKISREFTGHSAKRDLPP